MAAVKTSCIATVPSGDFTGAIHWRPELNAIEPSAHLGVTDRAFSIGKPTAPIPETGRIAGTHPNRSERPGRNRPGLPHCDVVTQSSEWNYLSGFINAMQAKKE
jgi:hypothetical protein